MGYFIRLEHERRYEDEPGLYQEPQQRNPLPNVPSCGAYDGYDSTPGAYDGDNDTYGAGAYDAYDALCL